MSEHRPDASARGRRHQGILSPIGPKRREEPAVNDEQVQKIRQENRERSGGCCSWGEPPPDIQKIYQLFFTNNMCLFRATIRSTLYCYVTKHESTMQALGGFGFLNLLQQPDFYSRCFASLAVNTKLF